MRRRVQTTHRTKCVGTVSTCVFLISRCPVCLLFPLILLSNVHNEFAITALYHHRLHLPSLNAHPRSGRLRRRLHLRYFVVTARFDPPSFPHAQLLLYLHQKAAN